MSHASAAGACGVVGPCLVVNLVGPNGEPEGKQLVTTAELHEWVDVRYARDGDYPFQTEEGVRQGREPRPVDYYEEATSLQTIVDHLSDRPGPFAGMSDGGISMAFVYPDGAAYRTPIAPANLGSRGEDDYPATNLPAAFYPLTDGLGFLRPLTGDDDFNAPDLRRTAPNGAYVLDLTRNGDVLNVSINPSETKIEAGVDIELASEITPGGHPGLTSRWDFDDGSPEARTRSTSHDWTEPGTYDVRLDVTSTDGSAGSAAVRITVGKKKTAPDPDFTPGGGGNGDPNDFTTGPDDSEGTQSGNAAGEESNGLPGGTGRGPDVDAGDVGGRERDEDSTGADGAAVTGILLTSASAATGLTREQPATLTSPSSRPIPEPQRDPLVYAAIAVPLLLLLGAAGELRPLLTGAATGTRRRVGARRRKDTT